jgi:O-acetyl-ADP-ribose deacetylase (regulator of RNase III)
LLLYLRRGFRLPAKHVIHTVGPVYDDYMDSEAEDLLTAAVR